MVDRHDAGQPITPNALLPECRKIFDAAAAGTLAELITHCPDTGHIAYHVGRIAKASRRRRLATVLSDCIADIDDAAIGVSDIEGKIEGELTRIRERSSIGATVAYTAGMELVNELVDGDQGQPVHTGINKVDRLAGGIMPGETMVIAARPGGGKSTLGMQIAKHTADRHRPVLFVSLEMRRQELIGRTLCGLAEVDASKIRQGNASNDIKKQLLQANAKLDGVPLFIADPPTATLQEIRALARLQQAKAGLSLLVIDYLRLIKPRDNRIDRRLQVAESTTGLKRLAKELQIPIVMLCQLNRAADREEPKLSNLAESAAVEQDADVVVFIQQDDENDFRLIYAKHRHGQTGSFRVNFDRRRFEFTER
jgi:replicative DNA helicase